MDAHVLFFRIDIPIYIILMDKCLFRPCLLEETLSSFSQYRS